MDQRPVLIDAARRLAAEEKVDAQITSTLATVHSLEFAAASLDS